MTTLLELYQANTHQQLVAWVANEFGLGGSATVSKRNAHRVRREEMARRVRLYKDDAAEDFVAIIRCVFENAKVRRQRVKFIEVASEQNITGKIVDEVASLYDRPAVRKLKQRDAQFHDEERRVKLHEIMQQAHRMLFLCNEVIVWQYLSIDAKTRLKVVTPDAFDVLVDPRDPLVMAGVLLDSSPVSLSPNRDQLPHYELWDDTYRYLISNAGRLVNENGEEVDAPIAHGQKRIPGVLLHKNEPSDRILDPRPGRDITSAHLKTALLNVMTMRLMKSQGERQPVLTGPAANVATDQAADGETPLVLGPNVTASMLDSVTDPKHYLDVKRDGLTSVGMRYGLSYETLAMQETGDSASGKTYTARREKLMELRGEQIRRARTNEAEVITLMAFDPEGVELDHQEQAIPQDATEKIVLLDMKMRKGLDNPIAFLMREDPDLDEATAQIRLDKNLEIWGKLIEKIRALNVPADDSAGGADLKKGNALLIAEETAGQSPQDNGAQGGGVPRSDGGNDGTATPQVGAKRRDVGGRGAPQRVRRAG